MSRRVSHEHVPSGDNSPDTGPYKTAENSLVFDRALRPPSVDSAAECWPASTSPRTPTHRQINDTVASRHPTVSVHRRNLRGIRVSTPSAAFSSSTSPAPAIPSQNAGNSVRGRRVTQKCGLPGKLNPVLQRLPENVQKSCR